MYLIFVAFSNYGDKNTKTFPIIVHFVQKKCKTRAKRRPKRAQAMLASALPCSIFCTSQGDTWGID